MNCLNNSFVFDSRIVSEFQEKGYVKMPRFLSTQFTAYLKNKIKESIDEPTDQYQKGFSRLKYDVFSNDQMLFSLFENRKFSETLTSLAGRDLFYTQGIGLELIKNQNKGFPWHIETQSFAYQHADDYAMTVWVPLENIDTQKQRGGMAYVPKNKLSGHHAYAYIDPAVFELLEGRISSGSPITIEEFMELRDGPLNSPALIKLYEYFAEEDDFNVGDVLGIHKDVIHRSIPLGEGNLESRIIFSMRFIGTDSTYDKKRATSIEISRQHFNYSGPTKLHLDVAKNEGERIIESPYFHHPEKRLIACAS
ncbi:putative JamE [Candidatus Glomeribacter gigasporarum BEG34]|uniref:Putative JamE n=1 Tax=Candidatus Glomeribacter gigasporarum BEG34 TaxID=1070319 RepID=G2JA36_9BURK|nr:phytanoyl-CoA dioxygenase family protein [Candidatus Glomeribacter gigasporarum]CCD29635.1 putative JamE [Candidatus Glomeribacter gigasporarum BEG34]